MKQLRILIPLHILPTEKHITTILFENLLPELKLNFDVSIYWLVYRNEKLDLPKTHSDYEHIIDFNDFSNCVDIINFVQPDIIYQNEDRGIIDLSFEIAANYLKIPVIVPINNASFNLNLSKTSQFAHFFKILKTFFHKEISNNQKISQKDPKRKFYFRKFSFLLKTMNACNLSISQKFSNISQIFKSMLSEKPPIFSYSKNNLYRLESPNLINPLIKKGFKKNSLFVTGNPMYDSAFKKLNSFKTQNSNSKIKVLFAPLQLYENGLWSKNHQYSSIEMIISLLSSNSNVDLIVKLHPSSVSMSDYENIFKKINSNVKISQSGDILNYIADTDVLVSFPGSSTIFIYALVAHKPIILCNFFNQERHQILKKNLAHECTNIDSLNDKINSLSILEQIPTDSIDSFLEENYFKTDGNSSKRLSDAILNFISQKN